MRETVGENTTEGPFCLQPRLAGTLFKHTCHQSIHLHKPPFHSSFSPNIRAWYFLDNHVTDRLGEGEGCWAIEKIKFQCIKKLLKIKSCKLSHRQKNRASALISTIQVLCFYFNKMFAQALWLLPTKRKSCTTYEGHKLRKTFRHAPEKLPNLPSPHRKVWSVT